MAGFAIRTSFAGHASNSARADNALTFKLDHHMGAGHHPLFLLAKPRPKVAHGERPVALACVARLLAQSAEARASFPLPFFRLVRPFDGAGFIQFAFSAI